MAQIPTYTSLTNPADDDLLAIVDISASDELKKITVTNLHQTSKIRARTSGNLGLLDGSGAYGINVVNGGNVGVGGSATPGTKLHIRKAETNNTAMIKVDVDADGYDSSIEFLQASVSKAFFGYDDSADKIKLARIFDNNDLVLDISTGFIGINIATPTKQLHVSGDVIFKDTNSILFDSSVPSLTSNTTLVINASNNINTNFNGGLLFIDGANGKIGVGTAAPSGKVQINGTGNLLEIFASSGSPYIKFNNNGSNAAYIVNETSILAIGDQTSSGATMLNISKSTGKVNIGGTSFDRRFTVTSADTIPVTILGSSTNKTVLLIETTNNSLDRDQIIGFRHNNSGTQNVNKVIGSFYRGAKRYFGIHTTTSADLSIDGAVDFEATLISNDVYIDTGGVISSANTPVVFGQWAGDDAAGTAVATGSLNIASITTPGANDETFTINFSTNLSNATYIVICHGIDTSDGSLVIARTTTKAVGSVVMEMYPAGKHVEESTITMVVSIIGAKINGTV